jgi:hypothetical protein
MAKLETGDLADARRNENDLLDARVAELKARAGLWTAIADAIKSGLSILLEERAAANGDPIVRQQGGRTTVVDPSARRRP